MEIADVGQIFRQRAVEKWLTIVEYDTLVEKNPQEDVDMDNDFKKIIENSTWDIITSRRMWFHFLPNIISVRLDVSPQEWAERVFLADRGKQEPKYTTIEEALKINQDRMTKLKDRLQKIYNVDFTNTSNYTKIIDTTGKTFDQVLEEFENYIEILRE